MKFYVVGNEVDPKKRQTEDQAFDKRAGAAITARRILQGISLAAVGRQIGKDATTVMRYESGALPMTVLTAARICHFIKLNPKELFK